MNYQEENNYPKAFLATGIIMAVMIALCYFIVFNEPQEIDGVGGIVVNYGTTAQGMGKDIMSTDEPSVSPRANKEQPTKVTDAPATEQKARIESSNNKVVTQDNEDAPSVNTSSKKSSTSLNAEKPRTVRKPVVNQNALYKGPSKKGSGTGDGTSNSPGNQGSRNGSPLSDNYGNGGTGNGVRGTQWSFTSMPEVKNTSRTPGIVVIDIIIDPNGNIIEAHSDRKTRMGDLGLINRCISAIKNAKLTSRAPASGIQQGQVVFKFDVD